MVGGLFFKYPGGLRLRVPREEGWLGRCRAPGAAGSTRSAVRDRTPLPSVHFTSSFCPLAARGQIYRENK